MRVLIIGGLGYIGSALIEEYKKEPQVEVDILDKRFVPHLVAGLPANFHFFHGDMKDKQLIEALLKKEPEIVHMLAAEVEAENSIHKERAIWENNFEATLQVFRQCPAQMRLMFASTGNLFGGVKEEEKYMNLTEEDQPQPKYPYAESKRAVEEWLLKSGRNFTTCRFGTNYGYAPGIRFNLVTNNFIKKALSGEPITIHGAGDNYRPTVGVRDAARALIFLAGKKEAQGEVFHVVNQNYKIKELAQEVAKLNPQAKLEYIAKEVPFSSYHLANEKIKKLGFRFQWPLSRALEDMKLRFRALGQL